MAIGQAALGLLAFLLGCSGTFAELPNSVRAKCSLIGTWKSDMANIIEIDSVSDAGVFSGSFYIHRIPFLRGIPPVILPLQGIQHQGLQPTFGFTVSANLHGPTAVVVGQCLENGKEELRTAWLMREEVESAAEDWGATSVGRSTFYRTEW